MDAVLFRLSDSDSHLEMKIAMKYFPVYKNRSWIPDYSRVICRYSCLPYIKELEEDLAHYGSKMINSYSQFQYIANFDYYPDVADYTFETWFDDFGHVPYDEEGPFVLKGRTNSMKRKWKDMMYAKNREDAIKVYCRLMDDDMIYVNPKNYLMPKK